MDNYDINQENEYTDDQAQESETQESAAPVFKPRPSAPSQPTQPVQAPAVQPTAPATVAVPKAPTARTANSPSEDDRYGLSTKIDRALASRLKFYSMIKCKRINQLIEEWITIHCPELPDNLR